MRSLRTQVEVLKAYLALAAGPWCLIQPHDATMDVV